MDSRNTLRFPPTKSPAAEGLGPLLRRLPHYIYLADLFRGRRVLEIGCGDGAAARWIAQAGAASVVGVDRSQPLIEAARARHRVQNLDFRVADYGALELEDRSFDVVCVPAAGAELLRWLGFLEEMRRVLVKGGNVVMAAPSADRPDARSGVSYHELVGRLGQLWGSVRVIGVTPFLGFSLVEFAEEEEIEDLALDTSLTKLGTGHDDVTEYLAVAGPLAGPPRGYMVVELPPAEGLEVIALTRGADPAALGRLEGRLAEAEAAHADAIARLRELEQALATARGGKPGDETDLRRRLSRAVEERSSAETELVVLRQRVERAEEEIGHITAQAAIEIDDARREARSARERIEVAERARQAAEESAKVPSAAPPPPAPAAPAPAPAPAAEPRRDPEILLRAADAHAEEMSRLRDELTERTAWADELRVEAAEAHHAASEARSSATVEAARADAAEAQLRALRDRLALLEGRLLGGSAPSQSDMTSPDLTSEARVAELQADLRDRQAALDKANERWKAAETKTDDLWRKVGDMQKELEANRESGVETARAQRQAAQIALTRAVDEASKKLVSVKDELARTLRERNELEKDVVDLRQRIAEVDKLRGENERLRSIAASAGERPGAQARVTQALEAVTAVDGALRAEEERLAALEEGIRLMAARREQVADVEEAPDLSSDPWASVREERIRELSAELGQRDAELAILHGTASAARRRIGELVELIARTRAELDGREAPDVAAGLDRLLAEATELADAGGERR